MLQDRDPKTATTYQEQVDRLIGRGLIVEDVDEAITALKRINYYRLTAYALTLFQSKDVFLPGTTFTKVYNYYQFDSMLRNMLMEIIEYIEISFRTHISYMIGHKYGPLGYENKNNFEKVNFHRDFLETLREYISRSKDELFINHHMIHKNGKIPIWVATEVTTFTLISKLYRNMKTSDRKEIVEQYYNNSDYRDVQNWLHVLSILRNRCAHYSRIYNYKIPKTIKIHPRDKRLLLDPTSVFCIIYNSKYLVTDKNIWDSWVVKLGALIEEFEDIDIKMMGFPENWDSLLIRN